MRSAFAAVGALGEENAALRNGVLPDLVVRR
jgi:hypothetical protein